MKKTLSLIILMILICTITVYATPTIGIDLNPDVAGVQTIYNCQAEWEEFNWGFYITGAITADNIDQISARVDYDNTKLQAPSAGKNIPPLEFMMSGGAGISDVITGLGNVDANTDDYSIAISGNHPEWAPIDEETAMKNTFYCKTAGTITAGTDIQIVDTRDIDTTKTWWAHGDLESGGEKRLFEEVSCTDNDGDGYGVCPNCGIANGCTYDGDDCDDTDEDINPGEDDLCNGIDDDCNAGTADGADEAWLGTACDGDDTDLCEEGLYECTAGSKTCTDNDAEHDLDLCNGADDDCNPATDDGEDEGWFGNPCDGADSDLCLEGSFICDLGVKTCTDNDAENDLDLCNGADDDCNAATDDGADEAWLNDPCDGADSDLCEEGNLICSGGFQTCTDDTGDDLEDCTNGLDDDCDTIIDCLDDDCYGETGPNGDNCCNNPAEDCTQDDCLIETCGADNECEYTNRAQCADTECAAGEYCDSAGGDCTDPNENSQQGEDVCEICTAAQHNFGEAWPFEDGTPYCCANDANEYYINDGVGAPACCDDITDTCVDAGGICRDGDENLASAGTCSDGIDNDCDGDTDLDDANCQSCTPGETQPCPKQDGVCTGSQETCNEQGQWPGCDDATYLAHNPNYENPETSCDNMDNDCDGNTDGMTHACGSDSCEGIQTCTTGAWSDCSTRNSDCGVCCICEDDNDPTPLPDDTQDEDCNYLDDDYCDGDIVKHDEGECVAFTCEADTTIIEDCDSNDNLYCIGDEVWEDDGYCLNAACELDSDMIEDCNVYDDIYCSGNSIWQDDGYCAAGICEVDSWEDEDCDDGIGCTDDSCVENGMPACENNPNDALCPDDTVCADYYCDGTLDCQVDYEADTTICRAQDGDCDVEEKCTGSSPDCPADDVQPDTYECRSAVNDCDVAENCDGTNKDCPTDDKAPAGTECGQARNCSDDACNGFFAEFYPIDGHDTCDGNGNCNVYSCAMEDSYCTDDDNTDGINTIECGAECDEDADCADADPTTIDICDAQCACKHIQEICDNGIDDEGDGLIDCEDPDCDGENGPGGVVCCQTDNTCNYLDDDCADGVCISNECEQEFKPATTQCRAAAGVCDIAETCTGLGADCPADAKSTAECRASAGVCDVAEVCDGINNDCPADAFKALGTDCGICAACDGAGTCVYDETQDNDCSCPDDECTDNNGDAIIDAYNDYIEPECEAIFICKDCGPTITEPDVKCKTTMKIPLEEGISMFSLPLSPETDKKFSDIQNGCTFHPVTGGDGIAYWDPLKVGEKKYEYLDDTAILYPGQGYFTYQQNDCDFTIDGYKFTINLVGRLGTNNLYNGWNTIGAPSEQINNFDLVEGTCTVTSGPWGFNPAQDQYVRTQILQPGKGYYIKTTDDCSLG